MIRKWEGLPIVNNIHEHPIIYQEKVPEVHHRKTQRPSVCRVYQFEVQTAPGLIPRYTYATYFWTNFTRQ